MPLATATEPMHKSSLQDAFRAARKWPLFSNLYPSGVGDSENRSTQLPELITSQRGKRPRYSPDTRKALTISAFWKLPPKVFSLFSQKL